MEGVGFVGGSLGLGSRSGEVAARCGRTTVNMAAKADENRKRRVEIVDKVKEQLDKSTLAFALPLQGYTVKEVSNLRDVIPENSSALAVKNTLLKRAIADSTWEVAGDLAKGSNLWIFTDETDMKGAVEAVKKFNKDNKKEETNGISGGVMENTLYDSAGVEALSKLPSKQDLYQKIAIAINSVPTKLGRSINSVPTKVGRAIKLATEEES
ncbi:hypothetical protein NDN08_005862 [Rhodosorus marinus]|uniref:50S ribosomal protein L10 n=1 Tax=Rhodosorus marinus TaxID=101924 RepID=A0AAV8V2T6_9RHOD|nr:hypothetical protein NDN08_005862 [Rhodosorus marinus]